MWGSRRAIKNPTVGLVQLLVPDEVLRGYCPSFLSQPRVWANNSVRRVMMHEQVYSSPGYLTAGLRPEGAQGRPLKTGGERRRAICRLGQEIFSYVWAASRSLSSHWIEVASKLGTSKLNPDMGKFSPCPLSTRQRNSKEVQIQGCFPRIRGTVVAAV